MFEASMCTMVELKNPNVLKRESLNNGHYNALLEGLKEEKLRHS